MMMAVFILLNLAATGLLVAVLWKLARLQVHPVQGKRKVSLFAAYAFVCVFLMLAMNIGMVIQERSVTNLHLPGSVSTKARIWTQEHAATPPKRGDIGTNIKLVGDGVDFFAANRHRIPTDAAARLEEATKLPAKVTKLLSPAEEEAYFEAARTIVDVIGSLAPPAEEPAKQ